jgi:hypothetical protein
MIDEIIRKNLENLQRLQRERLSAVQGVLERYKIKTKNDAATSRSTPEPGSGQASSPGSSNAGRRQEAPTQAPPATIHRPLVAAQNSGDASDARSKILRVDFINKRLV